MYVYMHSVYVYEHMCVVNMCVYVICVWLRSLSTALVYSKSEYVQKTHNKSSTPMVQTTAINCVFITNNLPFKLC